MTNSEVFQLCNTAVLPAWVILMVFPKKPWRNLTIYTFCIFLSGVYALYVFRDISAFDPASFSSLHGVKQLFAREEVILAGWIHYLAFDLLVGNWIVNQSIKYGIRHLWVVPSLFLCFMLGPIGYLTFSGIKVLKTKRLA